MVLSQHCSLVQGDTSVRPALPEHSAATGGMGEGGEGRRPPPSVNSPESGHRRGGPGRLAEDDILSREQTESQLPSHG